MKKEIALRMLADIFIPVGERDGFIASMYEMGEAANNTLERVSAIEDKLTFISESLVSIHSILADGMVRTEEHTLDEEQSNNEEPTLAEEQSNTDTALDDGA